MPKDDIKHELGERNAYDWNQTSGYFTDKEIESFNNPGSGESIVNKKYDPWRAVEKGTYVHYPVV